MAVSTLRRPACYMVAGAALLFAFACSDNSGSTNKLEKIEPGPPETTGGGGSTGVGGSTGMPATGGVTLQVSTGCGTCPEGTYCSARVACIPIGTCLDNADCGDGMTCDETGACSTGLGCGASEFNIESVPPNLLLVLDRSCSMTQQVGGGGPQQAPVDVAAQKWVPVVDALTTVTTELGAEIRFGLELFPDGLDPDSDCGQNPTGEIAVPIGPDGGAQTAALLQAARTDTANPIYPGDPCVTNTLSAIEQASQQPELDDPERESYVILITDGEPYCNDRSMPNETDDGMINDAIAALAGRGVPTFVVGFGDVANVDPDALARYAVSGGTTPSPDQPYYDAADGEQLLTALRTIGGSIVSCEYVLDSLPEDDDLYVFFNDDPAGVPRDPTHVEGWDFDPNTLTLSFYGQACQMLQDDQVQDIDVVYGCPDPVVG